MVDTTQSRDTGSRKAAPKQPGARGQASASARTRGNAQQRPSAQSGSRELVERKSSKLRSAMLMTMLVAGGAAAGFLGGKEALNPGYVTGLVNQAHANEEIPRAPGMNPAIAAVVNALPSVAILGQKPGPGGTVEVFIQVPGVLNMQSVYVLPDQRTVISGVVVEPLSGPGFPGGAIEIPSGDVTVNPFGPREDAEVIMRALGMTPEAAPAAPEVSRSVPAPTPSPAPRVSLDAPYSGIQGWEVDEQGNPLPRSGQPVPGGSGEPVNAGDTRSQVSGTQAAQVPAPAASTSPQVEQERASSGAPEEPVTAFRGDDPVVIESIDSLVGSAPFGAAVRHILSNDQDIDDVRQQPSAEQQQNAYLDLVKRLPAITQGSGPRHLYVMFDPNCPVCHRYYAQVQNDIAANRVTVHWIPAIVFPDERSSLSVASALAAEVDSRGGSAASDMLRRAMTEQGYIAELDRSDRVSGLTPYLESVAKNTAVMAMAKAETPLLIFQTTDGNLSISGGIPADGYITMIGHD